MFRIKRSFDNTHRALLIMLGIFQLLIAVVPAGTAQCFMDYRFEAARPFDDSWQKMLNAIQTKSETLQEVS